MLQVAPLRLQLWHIPKPPIGFRQAAALFDVTVRSVHPHSPSVLKVMLGWISTQYVPVVSTAGVGRFIVNVVPLCTAASCVAV